MNKTLTSPLKPKVLDSTHYCNAPKLPHFYSSYPDWTLLPDREIITNVPDAALRNNEIHTSKYNCITFLPKNLIEQFSKLANVYFLIIGFLQIIKEISTSGGIPVTFAPLSFILLVTALKDLYEDLKRHRSDNEENSRKTQVLTENGFKQTTWDKLLVGNIIKVQENEYLPADILILRTSEPKSQCFVETKNLDGETNLKLKRAHKDLSTDFNLKSLWDLKDNFSFERPKPLLYNFTGTYYNEGVKIPMDINNFVLRGCSLRNTKFIIGLVAYTGHDSKIMLNSTKARAKKSKVEVLMNKMILTVFVFQMLFCIFSGLYSAIWYSKHEDSIDYLEINRNGTKDNAFYYNFFVRMGNWLIIFQNFVPISLIVTLEMVKVFQGVIISKDQKMIFSQNFVDTPVTVQTSSLNEELGQVRYIFSDKTGTLTCNIMDFKKACINGISYGDDHSLPSSKLLEMPQVTNVDFKDSKFFDDLHSDSEQSNYVSEMLLSISLCHTIIANTKENGELVYNATSPDELALVNWARFCGMEFRGLDETNCMTVNFEGKTLSYELLQVLEFTSSRKRQSVILRDPSSNEIILYSKGADTILEKRLKSGQEAIRKATWDHLIQYASTGLRTLLIAKRTIKEEEYHSWAKEYLEACASIQDRETLMEKVQDQIEVGLEIVGATAIEDKLQDEVGETISVLKQAGINIWVLTGDKIETAINIGYSCQLMSEKLEKIIISGSNHEQVMMELDEGQEKLKYDSALIVTGEALIHISTDEVLSRKLLYLAERSQAVIACRVSPKQKQEVVALVRKNKKDVTTLAIGDGANDVNMITAAHVGIGIKGVEGQQAARASDYSIGEFKVLRRLVLFYGRESYRKNSYLICYNFFKNMVLVLPQFWFAFYNGFSGQAIYNAFLFQLYNIIYASLPVVIYAVFDKEHKGSYFLKNPYSYFQGPKNRLFNVKIFWMWIFFGIWQSGVLLFFTIYAVGDNFIDSAKGYTMNFWGVGMSIFGFLIVVTNVKVLIMSNRHSLLSLVIIFGSIAMYILTYSITSEVVHSFDDYGTFTRLFSSGNFYFVFILLFVTTSMLDTAFERLLLFSEEEVEGKYRLMPDLSITPPSPIANTLEQIELRFYILPLTIPFYKYSNRGLKEKEELESQKITHERSLHKKHTGYAYSQDEFGIDSFKKMISN